MNDEQDKACIVGTKKFTKKIEMPEVEKGHRKKPLVLRGLGKMLFANVRTEDRQ